jgi:hypothetical protein
LQVDDEAVAERRGLDGDGARGAALLAEGEMTERQRRGQPIAQRKVPWWRTWWALTLAGVALTGVTVGVVWLARPWLSHGDSSTAYDPMPQP